jgi:hypothetical protein
LFAALPVNDGVAFLQIDVRYEKATEFGSSNGSVEKEQYEGLIALRVPAGSRSGE